MSDLDITIRSASISIEADDYSGMNMEGSVVATHVRFQVIDVVDAFDVMLSALEAHDEDGITKSAIKTIREIVK